MNKKKPYWKLQEQREKRLKRKRHKRRLREMAAIYDRPTYLGQKSMAEYQNEEETK